MKQLEEQELKELKGGFSVILGLSVAALLAFLAGFIKGYVNPEKCGGE